MAGAETTTAAAPRASRWRLWLGIGVLLVGLYFCWKAMSTRGESMQAGPLSRLMDGLTSFNRSGDGEMSADTGLGGGAVAGVVPRVAGTGGGNLVPGMEDETDASLAALAERLKKAGFSLKGMTDCVWTRRQRDMFGKREAGGGDTAPARRVLESMYTECRTSAMCPGVQAYPTWVRGDNKFAGFQTPRRLRAMCDEAEQVEPRRMLAAEAEPVEENVPEWKHEAVEKRPVGPDMTREQLVRMLKEMDANAEGTDDAALEGGRGEGGDNSEAADSDDVTTDADPKSSGSKAAPRKECARGVSAYAPLNVPDMPGTEPLVLQVPHTDFQSMQGNVARAVQANHMPTDGMMRQVVDSFRLAADEAERRDPNASAFSNTREPHSMTITTGEAMADKKTAPSARGLN